MQLYFAPMEGVTPWHYRQTHAALFGGVDCYYTPFLNPTEAGLAGKALQEVLPEHNRGVNTVPQILTNNAERFVLACQTLAELGYTEVDLNLGCPSGTVVAKGRGAGFLAPSRREQLEAFLEEIFAKSPLRISLKTRLGMESPEEFAELLALYNRYPAAQLTIHARVREDYYKRPVRCDAFAEALAGCRLPVCYNGDIFTAEDALDMYEQTGCDLVMIGRGSYGNPFIFREIRALINGEEKPLAPTLEEKLAVMRRQVELAVKYKGEYIGMRESRRTAAFYLKGIPGAPKLRNMCAQLTYLSDIDHVIEEAFRHEKSSV